MKIKNISFGEWLGIAAIIIGFLTTLFTTEIKDMIMHFAHYWQYIVFYSSCILLIGMVIKWLFIAKISGYNETLIEAIKLSQRRQRLTDKILRDIVLPAFMIDDDKKRGLAGKLFDEGFNVDELAEYGLPNDIIKLVKENYHQKELDKLKK